MYNVVSKTFEGPFDILLDFAKDDDIDVARIAVLDIIENSAIRNVDEGSEFIVDAANLLYMKSLALLPRVEEVPATQEEVDAVKLLELYNKMKEVAVDLEVKERRQKEVFYREADMRTDFAEEEFKEATMYDLLLAFKSVLAYLPKEEILSISREGITVRQKMNEIIDYLEANPQIDFVPFLKAQKTREHIITTFLAILEMIKLGLIWCRHNVANNDIFITRKA